VKYFEITEIFDKFRFRQIDKSLELETIEDGTRLRLCETCRNWIEVSCDGEMIHNDEQSVECLMNS
jgi:hypothetical protein